MRTLRWILATGLTIALLDGAVAVGYWWPKGVGPVRIFQGIASALIDREAALGGGLATAALGLACHLALATTMAACYLLAAQRLPVLTAKPLRAGLLYGVATWAVMKFVVLPLLGMSSGRPDAVWQLMHFTSHLTTVGLVCAFMARAALARGALRG